MIRWLSQKSLFQQFTIAMIIVIFIPLVIITGFSYYRATDEISTLISDLVEKVVTDVSRQLDDVIENYDTLTLYLTNSEQLRSFVEQPADAYYEKVRFVKWIESETPFHDFILQSPIVNNLNIVGNDGMFYATNRHAMDGEALSRKESILRRAPALAAQYSQNNGTKIIASQVFQESPGGAFYISMGRVVLGENDYTVKGVLFTDIVLDELLKSWKREDIKDGYLWIVDRSGQILYHPDTSMIGTRLNTSDSQRLIAGERGHFTSTSDKGDRLVHVYSASKYSAWRVIATVPVTSFETPITKLRNSIWTFSILIVPIILICFFTFTRSILGPLYRLKAGMREVEQERFVRIEDSVLAGNEIGSLIRAYNGMVDRISDLIERVYKGELKHREDEIARKEAEYHALQMQINPHFLYNTLGTIHNYALIAGQTSIQDMIEALAHMFRYSIKDLGEPVQLHEEIQHVHNYLCIQKHRNSRMPMIRWETADFESCLVPRLMLQPLIENVFQHAFPTMKGSDEILIRCQAQGELLLVTVEDNGRGLREAVMESTFVDQLDGANLGIGLVNVHKRIRLKYGDSYGLLLRGSEGEGTTVTAIVRLEPPKTSEIKSIIS
jgi:two-component system sensor histidine kinase YesM